MQNTQYSHNITIYIYYIYIPPSVLHFEHPLRNAALHYGPACSLLHLLPKYNYKNKNSSHFYSAASHWQGWAHHILQDNDNVYTLYVKTSKIINYIVVILYSLHTHTHTHQKAAWRLLEMDFMGRWEMGVRRKSFLYTTQWEWFWLTNLT